MRAAFTGDDYLNRKFSEFSYPSHTMPTHNLDFSQSANVGSMGIARARPRSYTPNAQITLSSSNLSSTNNLFNRKVKLRMVNKTLYFLGVFRGQRSNAIRQFTGRFFRIIGEHCRLVAKRSRGPTQL
jgi:hypothetical protein